MLSNRMCDYKTTILIERSYQELFLTQIESILAPSYLHRFQSKTSIMISASNCQINALCMIQNEDEMLSTLGLG